MSETGPSASASPESDSDDVGKTAEVGQQKDAAVEVAEVVSYGEAFERAHELLESLQSLIENLPHDPGDPTFTSIGTSRIARDLRGSDAYLSRGTQRTATLQKIIDLLGPVVAKLKKGQKHLSKLPKFADERDRTRGKLAVELARLTDSGMKDGKKLDTRAQATVQKRVDDLALELSASVEQLGLQQRHLHEFDNKNLPGILEALPGIVQQLQLLLQIVAADNALTESHFGQLRKSLQLPIRFSVNKTAEAWQPPDMLRLPEEILKRTGARRERTRAQTRSRITGLEKFDNLLSNDIHFGEAAARTIIDRLTQEFPNDQERLHALDAVSERLTAGQYSAVLSSQVLDTHLLGSQQDIDSKETLALSDGVAHYMKDPTSHPQMNIEWGMSQQEADVRRHTWPSLRGELAQIDVAGPFIERGIGLYLRAGLSPDQARERATIDLIAKQNEGRENAARMMTTLLSRGTALPAAQAVSLVEQCMEYARTIDSHGTRVGMLSMADALLTEVDMATRVPPSGSGSVTDRPLNAVERLAVTAQTVEAAGRDLLNRFAGPDLGGVTMVGMVGMGTPIEARPPFMQVATPQPAADLTSGQPKRMHLILELKGSSVIVEADTSPKHSQSEIPLFANAFFDQNKRMLADTRVRSKNDLDFDYDVSMGEAAAHSILRQMIGMNLSRQEEFHLIDSFLRSALKKTIGQTPGNTAALLSLAQTLSLWLVSMSQTRQLLPPERTTMSDGMDSAFGVEIVNRNFTLSDDPGEPRRLEQYGVSAVPGIASRSLQSEEDAFARRLYAAYMREDMPRDEAKGRIEDHIRRISVQADERVAPTMVQLRRFSDIRKQPLQSVLAAFIEDMCKVGAGCTNHANRLLELYTAQRLAKLYLQGGQV